MKEKFTETGEKIYRDGNGNSFILCDDHLVPIVVLEDAQLILLDDEVELVDVDGN